ncbi:protein I'm not dead yet-like [Musca autumnalis]|uniref:protein I'm not dead yet-like n=1 Tax=Musca autumnalis TaxID=221902 RepID=UPI003CF9C262
MSYTQDSQMVFVLSCFIAIAIVNNKLDRVIALRLLKGIGVDPLKISTYLMVSAYILSIFIPNACACSLMIPIARATLNILDELGVCKAVEDNELESDDEPPQPSKVANAFYIGIAFAANIGGMLTYWYSESGYEFLEEFKNENLTTTELSVEISIVLLIFTIIYLQVIFLNLWRSKRPRRISFDNGSIRPTLDVLIQAESEDGTSSSVITGALMTVYICVLIVGKFLTHMEVFEITINIKYSTFVMLICLLAFVCPNNCSYMNYFLCRAPNAYKMSSSILPWSIIPKMMPWNYFLVYGSSLAFGVALEKSYLHIYLVEHLAATNNTTLKLMGFMAVSILLSLLGANHLVSRLLMIYGVNWASMTSSDPTYFALSLGFTSSLAFMLPISSVSNCFAAGWGNLRSKDIMIAGIGPTVFGYFLVFGVIELDKYLADIF